MKLTSILVSFLVFAGVVSADEFGNSFVEEHNKYRSELGIPGVEWSPDIAKYAQEWADHLKKQKCKMQHRSRAGKKAKSYGENLAWASGKKMNPAEVVKMWYDEVEDYNYDTNKCRPGAVCGHYTQVIWKNSKQIGCGMATCGKTEIWVCNYDPPGNYIGQKPY